MNINGHARKTTLRGKQKAPRSLIDGLIISPRTHHAGPQPKLAVARTINYNVSADITRALVDSGMERTSF